MVDCVEVNGVEWFYLMLEILLYGWCLYYFVSDDCVVLCSWLVIVIVVVLVVLVFIFFQIQWV